MFGVAQKPLKFLPLSFEITLAAAAAEPKP